MRRLVHFVVGIGAWLEQQIVPPHGKDGITPARITVITGDQSERLVQRRRRA
jgi:hypothetical protein